MLNRGYLSLACSWVIELTHKSIGIDKISVNRSRVPITGLIKQSNISWGFCLLELDSPVLETKLSVWVNRLWATSIWAPVQNSLLGLKWFGEILVRRKEWKNGGHIPQTQTAEGTSQEIRFTAQHSWGLSTFKARSALRNGDSCELTNKCCRSAFVLGRLRATLLPCTIRVPIFSYHTFPSLSW